MPLSGTRGIPFDHSGTCATRGGTTGRPWRDRILRHRFCCGSHPPFVGCVPQRDKPPPWRDNPPISYRAPGVTLHLLGALPEYGKLGAVCIADDAAEAEDMYTRVEDIMGELAAR